MSSLRQVILFTLTILSLITVTSLTSCDNYYKLCEEECLMHGSDNAAVPAGTFDLPCSDNVTFMIQHIDQDDGMDLESYKTSFGGGGLTVSQVTHGPIAMHYPLYPKISLVGGTKVSEEITFTLKKDLSSIVNVNLYIRENHMMPEEYDESLYSPMNSINELKVANWCSTSPGVFAKQCPASGGAPTFDHISFTTCFQNPRPHNITFITYRFEVTYVLGSVPPSDKFDVTFALQDFNNNENELFSDYPAPVYVQGAEKDIVDVLFVQARENMNYPLTESVSFNKQCQTLISEHIFHDPTVKFWRKQFNFWLSPKEGYAYSYEESTGCHVTPFIPEFIEVTALLHNNPNRQTHRDYTCNGISTGYLKNGNIVMHEIGHSAFRLEDEYETEGNSEEKFDHFPNIWETKEGAKNNATYRHKSRNDVKKVKP